MWDKGLARHAEKFADKIIKATAPPPLPGEWIRKRMDRLDITQDNLANMSRNLAGSCQRDRQWQTHSHRR